MGESNHEAVLRDQEAATARGDADGVIAALADDVVTFDLPPPLESRGLHARDAPALKRWFATWDNGVIVEFVDQTVLVENDLAVAFGLSRMRGDKRDQGPMTAGVGERWSCGKEMATGGSFTTIVIPDVNGRFQKAAIELRPEEG